MTTNTEPVAPIAETAALAIEASNITVQFGGLTAIDDVTFTVPEKSVVSLI